MITLYYVSSTGKRKLRSLLSLNHQLDERVVTRDYYYISIIFRFASRRTSIT